MKLIIAGSRTVTKQCQIDFFANKIKKKYNIKEIVSGRCHGPDIFGEHWASKNNIKKKYFPAKWKEYGKGAGFKRNTDMAKYADALLALWDGKSSGTKDMIDKALTLCDHVWVVNFKETRWKLLKVK